MRNLAVTIVLVAMFAIGLIGVAGATDNFDNTKDDVCTTNSDCYRDSVTGKRSPSQKILHTKEQQNDQKIKSRQSIEDPGVAPVPNQGRAR